MSDLKHPELHTNEEVRNDFIDVGVGFAVFFVVLLLMGVAATVIQVVMK